MKNIYEVKSSNKWKSALILFLFIVVVTFSVYIIGRAAGIYLGYETGGLGIVGIAFIISGLMSFGGYYFSDKIILSISGAKEADRSSNFKYFTAAENLSIAAGITKPKLYVIRDTALNAFATGRDPEHAVVCATTGLINKLDKSELEGVIAHELTHVKNYDTRLMSVVTVLVGVVALLADWFLRISWISRGRKSNKNSGQLGAIILVLGLVFALLSPLIAKLIQLTISRRREFMADAGSVEITRQPNGLINALKKISNDHEPLEAANKATAHLYISNPFKDKSKSAVSWFSGLFNTHPPLSERIKMLEEMS